MKIATLAVLAGALAGCSVKPVQWRAETAPAVLAAPVAASAPKIASCPPIGAAITAEAQRSTPLEAMRTGGVDALTAALMRSEAEKNARLRQAVAAYEVCWRR
jgi:hypothetical protein